MACKFCQSAHQGGFPAEINIHFPDKENLTRPTLWVFPRLLICVDCGFAEFSVGPAELQKLKNSEFSELKNDVPALPSGPVH